MRSLKSIIGLIASVILLSLFLAGNADAKGGSSRTSRVIFKVDPGIINLPVDVLGVEFDYAGIEARSLLGRPLDLTKITYAFNYSNSTSYYFKNETLNGFSLNSVGLTDVLLKWHIQSLVKHRDQGFILYYSESQPVDSIRAAIAAVPGVYWVRIDRPVKMLSP